MYEALGTARRKFSALTVVVVIHPFIKQPWFEIGPNYSPVITLRLGVQIPYLFISGPTSNSLTKCPLNSKSNVNKKNRFDISAEFKTVIQPPPPTYSNLKLDYIRLNNYIH